MMKVFLTGAGGFIGRNLIKKLHEQNIEVLGCDNTGGRDDIKKISLLDYDELKKQIAEFQPDTVIHLAAIALAIYGNTSEIYNVNVVGTEILLKVLSEVCKNKVKLILISTAGVYGNQSEEFYHEDLPFNPANHYSYSKMVTEYMLRQHPDLEFTIVRPFNIIGVGQRQVFLIPKLVEHFAKKSRELHVGNLKPERDYVDINYCVYILSELAQRNDMKHSIYNICSGVGHSVEDIIKILAEYSGHNPEIVVDPAFVRKNEVWRMVGDPTRLLDFVNGKKCSDFRKTLIDMYEYSKNNMI